MIARGAGVTDGARQRRQVLGVLGWVRQGEEVLLVRRHQPGVAALHGRWELPGGKIAFGEAPEVAVAREVLEETGYAVEVRSLFPYTFSTVWESPEWSTHVILLVFDCRVGAHTARAPDASVMAVAWRRPEAIDFEAALPSVRHFVAWWQARPADA